MNKRHKYQEKVWVTLLLSGTGENFFDLKSRRDKGKGIHLITYKNETFALKNNIT